MKINPINEMTVPVYREIKPVDNKELEKAVEKVGAAGQPEIKEPYKPDLNEKKPEVDDGRETIGVSNDGDIAKASKAGLENMNEGLVLRKTPEPEKTFAPEPEKQVTENADKVESPADKAKTQSLVGYSKDELERLYQQGEINSNQLDKELERRETIRGEKKEAADAVKQDEKDEKKVNEDVATAMEDNRENGVKQVTAQNEEVVRNQKEAANKQADAVQEKRQDEMVNEAENNNEANSANAENRKQIITEEMDRDDQFVREMSVLSGAQEDTEIKSEAFETAVENGRLKLMEEVFNVDPATASNA
ncbi:MAG: hypothetical protein K6E63_06070 [Lachnospiraceae bacterium]|nr:hypothetical protein [Lachnospiraceae bacterium]